MRHGSSGRRQRNRGNQGRTRTNNKNQVFDSNGPDVRIRGTAFQVAEKYMALAKDSVSSGDEILAQSYLQHAEHYHRIINSWGDDQDGSNTASSSDKSEKNEDEPKGKKATKNPEAHNDENDLSLPTSILGGDVEALKEQLETT